MTDIVFGLVLASELILGAGLVTSILWPKWRVWPPPSRQSWQFWFVWILFAIAYAGLIVLAVLDWDSFMFPLWLRYAVGLPLFIGGLFLAFWGAGVLGWRPTQGLKGDLKTEGLYRYTRNPQYLGDILNLVGLVLFSNAMLVLAPSLLAALLFVLWPFTEEPWLKDRFGAAYERYCARVPRFVGFTRSGLKENHQ